MKKILTKILLYSAAAYLAACATLFVMQWRLLYPSTKNVSSLEMARKSIPDLQEHSIRFSQGNVRAFYSPGTNGNVMVFYYGNKETMRTAVLDAAEYSRQGYGVLACSYPGYDGNPGFTRAALLYSAGTACVDFLNKEMKVPDKRIILHGHSLGGHLAVHVAQDRDLKAVVLLAPLGSAFEIARSRYPMFPLRLIMLDKLISYEKAKRMRAPLFVAHDFYDKVVPYGQGLRIYNESPSARQMLSIDYLMPDSNGHGDIYDYGIKPDIIKWLSRL